MKFIAILFLFFTFELSSQELSLSARLSQPDGSPLEGVVDLRFELSYSGAPETVICTKDMTGTSLTNGLFQLGLNFSSAECGGSSLSDILEGVPTSEAMLFRVVDVTDPANPRTYPFQSLKAVPLSVRSEVAQTLARNSAVEGQVLRFVGGEWTASNETAEVGTVSEINTGAGLTGGPITSSGTIAIANSGVTSAMVADGTLVDADLSATAALARTKIATGTANYVLVNDGSGVMSEIAILPLSSGGTGAANAADARFNLGLGNAALRNVGLLAGELLDSGEIPSCALDEKIRKVVMPVAGFVCESSADATKLALAGGTMSGPIDMNSNMIANLADPSLAQDAATKSYVDGQIGGGAANQWSESGGNVYRASGNVGVGTSSPAQSLDVSGVTKTSALMIGDFSSEKNLHVFFPEGVADQKVDIYWPSSTSPLVGAGRVQGTYEFTVTSGFDNANANGGFKKIFGVYGRSSGQMTVYETSIPYALGSTASFFSLSDITWDSANSRWRTTLSNLSTRGNRVTVNIKSINPYDYPAIKAQNVEITAPYTDATVYPRMFANVKGKMGFGTSQPVTKVHLQDGAVGGAPTTTITDLRIENATGTAGIDIYSLDANSGRLNFGSPANNRNAAIWGWNNNGDPTLIFRTANVEALRINSLGNVGIGVLAPEAKLDINGQIKISGGSPGAGKVLTSDAAGLATWVSPSTSATPSGAASGDLSGNYPGPVIAAGAVTDAKVAAGANIAQSKIANLTTDLAAKQAADADLTGLSNLATNGVVVRTGSGTYQTRSLQGITNRTVVTNADGVAGNPSVDISATLLPSPLAGDNTRFLRATGANSSSWQALQASDITSALGFTPINKAGDTIGSGVFDYNSTSVVRANSPVGTRDVANKSYVDSQVSGAANQWTASGGNVYRASGNVGIGLSNPTQKLEVSGNVKANSFFSESTTLTLGTPLRFIPGGAGDSAGVTRIKGESYGGSFLKFDLANVHSNNSKAWIGSYYNSNFSQNLAFYSGKQGDITYPENESALNAVFSQNLIRFHTAPTGNNPSAERMRISASGNVGIGTDNPTSMLDVAGDIRTSNGGDLILDAQVSGIDPVLYSDNGELTFLTNNLARMTLSAGGSLGIGQTNPTGKLFIGSDWRTSDGGTSLYLNQSRPGGSNTSDLSLTISKTNSSTTDPLVPGVTLYNDDTTAGGWSPMLVFAKAESGTTPFKTATAAIGSRSPLGTGNGGSWIDGEMHFYTSGASTQGLVSRMVLNKAGNLGIGYDNPIESLVLARPASSTEAPRLLLTDTQTRGSIHSTSGDAAYGVAISPDVRTSGSGAVYFSAHTGGGGGTLPYMIFRGGHGPSEHGSTRDILFLNTQNGNVGIEVTNPSVKLDVAGDVRATSFISTSDRRLKKQIYSVPGLETITKLEGVGYRWRDNDEPELGLIAQDLEKVLPDLVVTDEASGYKAVKYQGLFAPIIESIKEIYSLFIKTENDLEKSQRRIKELEVQVEIQNREIASLKSENLLILENQKKIQESINQLKK